MSCHTCVLILKDLGKVSSILFNVPEKKLKYTKLSISVYLFNSEFKNIQKDQKTVEIIIEITKKLEIPH